MSAAGQTWTAARPAPAPSGTCSARAPRAKSTNRRWTIMQRTVQVSFQGLPHSDEIERACVRELAKLERLADSMDAPLGTAAYELVARGLKRLK